MFALCFLFVVLFEFSAIAFLLLEATAIVACLSVTTRNCNVTVRIERVGSVRMRLRCVVWRQLHVNS